jgi:hypothetical protein
MYPFNVINWVKLVLLSGVMSVCMGVIFLGIRWRYWDRAWQKDPIFEQVKYLSSNCHFSVGHIPIKR